MIEKSVTRMEQSNAYHKRLTLKDGDDDVELCVETYQNFNNKDEQIVAIELWDLVERCPVCHVEMTPEMFKKFKDYINSL